MKNSALILRLVAASVIGIFLWNCSESSTKPDDDPGDNGGTGVGTVVLAENTKVLKSSDLNSLTSYSPEQGTLKFSSANETIKNLKAGDIVVAGITDGAEQGFFRKISAVSTNGSDITFNTTQANFEEAIESGHMRFTQTLSTDQINSVNLEKGLVLKKEMDSDYTIINIPGYEITNGVTVTGRIGYKLDLEFEIEVKDFKLKNLSFVVTSGFLSDLNFTTTVNTDVDKKINLRTIPYTPITFMVAELPVVLTPELSIYIGMDGRVSAGITTGVEQKIDCEGGLEYQGNWSTINNFNSDFEFAAPELTDACHLSGYLGPELALKLYDVVGPYAYLRGYVELDANMVDNLPWWGLYGGFKNGMGVKLEVLGVTIADYEPDPIIDYRKTLMTGQGDMNHNWELQNLETITAGGKFSIDLDEMDTPYICYQATSGANQVLRLARLRDGYWEFETVDYIWNQSYCWPKLRVRNIDDIHIAYMGWTGDKKPLLKYAHFNNNSWQIDTLASYDAFGNINLLVDVYNNIHIFAINADRYQLHYFNKTGSNWSEQVIFTNFAYYEGSFSCAIDQQNIPNLFYIDPNKSFNWQLGYFSNNTWTTATVYNETGRLLMHSSLAFDKNNNPLVAYNTYYNTDLFLVSGVGSSWQNLIVDENWVGEYVTLNLDQINIPHISYYDHTRKILKYAYWQGSGWGIEQVDRTADVGRFSDSVLDSQGKAHIAYYDYTNKIVKYARFTGTLSF